MPHSAAPFPHPAPGTNRIARTTPRARAAFARVALAGVAFARVVIAGVAFAGAGLLGGCLERTQPTVENGARPVQAVRVVLAPQGESRQYPGIVRPRHEADIGFRAGGRIVSRSVDAGAHVTQGQELARLDPADLLLAMRAAEADLAAAQATLTMTLSDAQRSRTLTSQGWNAAAADEVKQAAAKSAIQKVASANAALSLARNKLDYAVLRAPAAGTVTAALVDPGTVVAEGQPVLRVAEAGALEAEVALPESMLPDAAREGASVSLWARPDIRIAARLRELSPTADPRLRTYTARYTLADPPDWIAIGMTATVQLASGGGAPVANLPSAAISDRGDGPMVWVVDPQSGTITARRVGLMGLRQDHTLVSGLKDGELVVGMGVQKLDPAARVRVADIRPITE